MKKNIKKYINLIKKLKMMSEIVKGFIFSFLLIFMNSKK